MYLSCNFFASQYIQFYLYSDRGKKMVNLASFNKAGETCAKKIIRYLMCSTVDIFEVCLCSHSVLYSTQLT